MIPTEAMVEMSQAIRMTLQKYGPTLNAIPDDELHDLADIVWAYALDLRGEEERRRLERVAQARS